MCSQAERGHPPSGRQRGSAMVEFVVVGPIITLLGLGILQYCLMFFAQSQMEHATFMAARAGSVSHINVQAMRSAYQRALIPLYGGGQTSDELASAYARVLADVTPQTLRIEVLNPHTASFDDFATDAALNAAYGVRAIPNTGLALRPDLTVVGRRSGQTLHDANLLTLRVTQGYKPKVWLLGMLYQQYFELTDKHTDLFHSQQIADGRIPMVTRVTLEMQSEALEPERFFPPD